jgi:magnesium chelatase family protein
LLEVIEGLTERSEFRHVDSPGSGTIVLSKDITDVKGQAYAKWALTIAATGGHNVLLYGAPGTGKSMLAECFIGLLPGLSIEQALEVAAIASVGNDGINIHNWLGRPYRSPHHSASAVSIVGGGSKASPGEISLAHNGVLFLDEFPEFDKKVLANLREPLESGKVSIARAAYRSTYPADFILIAAMNPCNCGYLGDVSNPSRCRCTPDQTARYRGKISGPLLYRIDMHIEVPRVPQEVLSAPSPEDEATSEQIRQKVEAVQALQIERQGVLNSKLSVKQIDQICALDKASQHLIDRAMNQLGLSTRGYHRVLKLARSIADFQGSTNISELHLGQAIQLRSLDR